MSVSRTPNQKKGKDEVGLLAFGSSGPWEVAIDETLARPARHFAQIEGPSVYLYFEIPSVELVDQVIDFLAVHRNPRADSATTSETLCVVKNANAQVSLIRDDEFDDRFFLAVQATSGPLVRLTLTTDDLHHIANALRCTKEDLDDND